MKQGYFEDKTTDWKLVAACILLVITIVVFLVIIKMGLEPISATAIETLPSQSDIQQMLVDRGADIEVDGVVGAKTRKEWDRLVCDQINKELWPKGE